MIRIELEIVIFERRLYGESSHTRRRCRSCGLALAVKCFQGQIFCVFISWLLMEWFVQIHLQETHNFF